MIVKRTKELTSPYAVMKWARDYVDKTRKHEGEDIGALGIGIGRNYFTSRPVGLITAHGYAKKRTETITVARGLRGNDAVLAMLREHCRERAMKKRKVYGLRFVMSLDPEKTTELALQMVDIDRVLVRSIEDTVGAIEKKYYPGDELGYVVGIHHDAITKDPEKPRRPRIHAHVMFLPQTEKGLRISFSNHTEPLRDGQFHNILDAIREFYRGMMVKHISNFKVLPEPRSSKEWVSLVKECAYHAADDMQEQQGMTPPSVRRFVLNKFSYYLTTSTRETVRRRYNYRMTTFSKGHTGDMTKRWTNFGNMVDDALSYAGERLALQSKPLEEAAAIWVPKREHEVKVWEFSPRAELVRKPTKTIPSRKEELEKMFEEMQIKRHAYRVNLVGELAAQEWQLGRLTGEIPEWINTLGKISAGELQMPNRDILRLETPQEAPEPANLRPTEPVQPALEPGAPKLGPDIR